MDSRDLGMLWSLRDCTKQKKVSRGLGLYLTSTSASTWPTPCPSLAHKLVCYGSYTRFTPFSLSCALVVFHLIYHSCISFIFRRSRFSIFHLYIYNNHVTVHHTYIHALLSWTTSTYTYTRTRNRSRLLTCFNIFLNALSVACTCITYIIPMHRSIIHAFPDNFILQISHTYFLEQLYITTYILRFGLVIQAGFVIAIHGLMTPKLEYYKLRKWFSATGQSV